MSITTDQQKQAHDFFADFAQEWRRLSESTAKLSVINQRNGAVINTGLRLAKVEAFLDVGCGTGELVLEMATKGVTSVGVDFVAEMVSLCEEKRERLKVDKASFRAASIFDCDFAPNSFDLIGANGFFEYLNFDETRRFLELCHTWLRPGGAVVFSSRNRLFNLLSLNDFTRMELALGTTDGLLREAVAINTAATNLDAIKAAEDNAFDVPPPEDHPVTGVPVKPRYQYTPGQVLAQCRAAGLTPIGLTSIHFHGTSPAFADQHKDLHSDIASRIYADHCQDPRVLVASSTFIVSAQKG